MRSSARRRRGAGALVAFALVGCGSADDSVAVPGAPSQDRSTGFDTDMTEPATTSSSPPSSTATSTTTITTTIAVSTTTSIAAPVTTASPASTSPIVATVPIVFLRAGDEGPEVADIQTRLIALDYLAAGSDNGVFDRATNSAVLTFQGDYGLIVDGVVGPETISALNAAAASAAPAG